MRWRAWFAGCALLFGAWALATPLFSAPDEGAHAVRAAATVRGSWEGTRMRLPVGSARRVTVPPVVAAEASTACLYRHPRVSAACIPPLPHGTRPVAAYTYEYRSPPVYYLAVGWPSRVLSGAASVYGMRLLSALACAALVATAFSVVASSGGVATIGVLVAVTPLAAYLAGSVNPNGVEIAAAVCAWAGIGSIAVEPSDASRGVRAGGIGLSVLVLCRGLSIAWAGIAVGVLLVLLGGARARALSRRADVRRWGAAVGAATAFSVVWLATVGLTTPVDRRGDGLLAAAQRAPSLLADAVGLLGNLDLRVPGGVVAAWAGATAVVCVVGWRSATGRHRTVVAALLVAGILIPIGADGFNIPAIGFGWEARFGLPLLVGVPIIAALVARDWVEERGSAPRALLLALLLAAAHLDAFAVVGRRFGTGLGAGGGPLRYLWRADWSPLVPAWLLLAAAALGLGVLVRPISAARGSLPPAPPEPAPPDLHPRTPRRASASGPGT